jgi:DNA-binding GntR family transcriptional regulator
MMLGTGRLVVKSTEDQVYETLRLEIMQGIEPGTPLRLSAIAERLGVSTMPVRAALRRLEREGLVRQTARKGAVVAPLELHDIQEIQSIRWGIEGLAARVGAQAVSDAELARMRGHLSDIRAAARARDLGAFLTATYACEDVCYAASARPRLLETVRHYRRAAQRYVLLVMANDVDALQVRPIEAFYAAVAARDGAATEATVQGEIIRLYDRLASRMGESFAAHQEERHR